MCCGSAAVRLTNSPSWRASGGAVGLPNVEIGVKTKRVPKTAILASCSHRPRRADDVAGHRGVERQPPPTGRPERMGRARRAPPRSRPRRIRDAPSDEPRDGTRSQVRRATRVRASRNRQLSCRHAQRFNGALKDRATRKKHRTAASSVTDSTPTPSAPATSESTKARTQASASTSRRLRSRVRMPRLSFGCSDEIARTLASRSEPGARLRKEARKRHHARRQRVRSDQDGAPPTLRRPPSSLG